MVSHSCKKEQRRSVEFYESCSPARNSLMPIKFPGRGAEYRGSSELSMPTGAAVLSMATGTEARRLEYPIYS